MEPSLKLAHVKGLAALVFLNASVACAVADESATRADDFSDADIVAPKVMKTRTLAADAVADEDGERVGSAAEALNSGHGINYNGGHVMSGTVNMYYIWYGNWGGNSAPTILNDFANNISGSPYYNINTTYDDNFHTSVSNAVKLAGSTTDNYSQGSNLSFNQIWSIVTSAIQQNRLPNDPNGVYFVLTSADVNQSNGTGSSFCTQYCGWHTYGTLGNNIKFSFVGNGDRCPSSCGLSSSPNNNAGADGMASVLAHELEETVTDPQIDAWHNANSEENADKCAWKFGTTYKAANGATANMKLGNRDYLIQQNWLNTGAGSCVTSYQTPSICGTMSQNEYLSVGQSRQSCDGRFKLIMQPDGNLVLYQNGGGALWASNTFGSTGSTAAMQSDGNFVLYNTAAQPLFSTGTYTSPGAHLAIQNDGNLVVYAANGAAIWASGTNGH